MGQEQKEEEELEEHRERIRRIIDENRDVLDELAQTQNIEEPIVGRSRLGGQRTC